MCWFHLCTQLKFIFWINKKKWYIIIKDGVLNKFYNVISCKFSQSMKQFDIMIIFTYFYF